MKFRILLAAIALGCCVGLNSVTSLATTVGQQAPEKKAVKKIHRVMGELPFSYSFPETQSLARKNSKPIFAYFTFET